MAKESFRKRKKIHFVFRNVRGTVTSAMFLLAFGLSACISSKHIQPITQINADPHAKGLVFIDSLKVNKIDAIIGYYAGCNDCQPYSNSPYYVFWSSKDIWFATKFARTRRYNILNGYTPPINYVQAFLDTLQDENLETLKVIKSSYHYEEVTIILEDAEFDFTIKHYERQNNSNAHRVVLTDRIRSALSNIPDTEWKAVDY